MEADEARAQFDAARARFETAMTAAPVESLGYLPAGDEYSLGGLLTHVNGVLLRYRTVLDLILAGGGAEVDARAIDAEMAVTNARCAEGLSGPERDTALDTMAAHHDHVAGAVAGLSPSDWTARTPVRYGVGDPFGTRPADIIDWLTGHYEEHVPHIEKMLAEWRSASPGA